jgi:hypothetical protein
LPGYILLQLHGWRPFGPREPAAFLLPRSIRRSSEKKNVSIGRRRSRGGAGRYIEMRRTLTVSVQSGGMTNTWFGSTGMPSCSSSTGIKVAFVKNQSEYFCGREKDAGSE